MISRERLHKGYLKSLRRCPRRYYVDEESYQVNLARHRKTTELCSSPHCLGCRNPRHLAKGKERFTNQERRKIDVDLRAS